MITNLFSHLQEECPDITLIRFQYEKNPDKDEKIVLHNTEFLTDTEFLTEGPSFINICKELHENYFKEYRHVISEKNGIFSLVMDKS